MTLGRNDPCHCGSGKKFKKCCGVELPTVQSAPLLRYPTTPHVSRQCGACTACCDGWVRMVIHGHDVRPGKPCPYSTGHSCRIYESRPVDPCREFICGWLEANSPLPEEFRPDKIGVIFVPMLWRGIPVYVLTPAGRDPDETVLAWTRAFAAESQRPFVYGAASEWYAFGPAEFQLEVQARVASGRQLW